MRIPMYEVTFALRPGDGPSVLRVPQDLVDAMVRVLMLNGVTHLDIQMEDENAPANG